MPLVFHIKVHFVPFLFVVRVYVYTPRLQDKWSSAYDCRTILLSIQSLLGGENDFLVFLPFGFLLFGYIVSDSLYNLVFRFRTK